MIGSYFVKKHKLTAAAGSDSSTRVGVGGGTRTRTGHLSGLRLGDLSIKNPEANLFTEGSPADPPLAGHIGLELLQEYRVIFDYTRRRMILEPIG